MLNKKQKYILTLIFLLFPAGFVNAAWEEPSAPPTDDNAAVPVYSEGIGQTLNGTLHVDPSATNATSLQGSGSTNGIQGNSVGNALFGNLTANAGNGNRAVYGLAVDAGDYGLYTSGGLGLGLASGDIYFLQQNSGIAWPRESDSASLYGVQVNGSGELRLYGHGGGINFLDQNQNSRLTVSEAGVVNVASGGSLTVNTTPVCLQDGIGCPTTVIPTLQQVTTSGNSTTNGLDLRGAITNSTGDLTVNDWVDVQWGLNNSTANNGGNVYVSDDLKVTVGAAFGGYDPSATHKVTTPTLYAGAIQIQGGTGHAGKVLTADNVGNGTWQAVPGSVGGSGTAGYIAQFTAGTTLGNSNIYTTGTNVGLGTANPTGGRLHISAQAGVPLYLETYSGNASISMDSGNTNFNTDRPNFSFNKPVSITGTISAPNLSVSSGGAFGGYALDASHLVTTPSLYGNQARAQNLGVGKEPSASYRVDASGDINATQFCINGNCKGTDWGAKSTAYGTSGTQQYPAIPGVREYVTLDASFNNFDYFCPQGFVMIGLRNSTPGVLICGKMW